MEREKAYQFLRLYKEFQDTGIKIVDYTPAKVELQFPGGKRAWMGDIEAALSIEAGRPRFTEED